MAETNTRREARRRRILENSENRLRKITASNNANKIKGNYYTLFVADDGTSIQLYKFT
ncbi:hypothetical protein EAG_14087 [Camponotus floridanus]|uniref:Uncharacterized protein n=1 Tax=Camponotus floridanus TaxID=104421 RepID=E1ZX85_CAMFO|nr:hypothetical protein EAG_14087 [Camponotus floridanus]